MLSGRIAGLTLDRHFKIAEIPCNRAKREREKKREREREERESERERERERREREREEGDLDSTTGSGCLHPIFTKEYKPAHHNAQACIGK